MLFSKLLSFHFHFPCIQGIERAFLLQNSTSARNDSGLFKPRKALRGGPSVQWRGGCFTSHSVTPDTFSFLETERGWFNRQISQDGPKFQEFRCKWNMINLSLSYSAFFSQKDCNVTSEQLPLSLVEYLALSSTILKFFPAGQGFLQDHDSTHGKLVVWVGVLYSWDAFFWKGLLLKEFKIMKILKPKSIFAT